MRLPKNKLPKIFPCAYCGSEQMELTRCVHNKYRPRKGGLPSDSALRAYVKCHDCMLYGPTEKSPAQAIKAWNELACVDVVPLLGCSSKKKQTASRADVLYQGALFKASLRWIRLLGFRRYFILSGRHGVLQPQQKVAPYDAYLGDMNAAQRRRWAQRVGKQLMELVKPTPRRWLVFAGRHYWEHLQPYIEGQVITPLRGAGGYAQQVQHLKGLIKQYEQEAT